MGGWGVWGYGWNKRLIPAFGKWKLGNIGKRRSILFKKTVRIRCFIVAG
jgi:hypothetical protein